MSAAPILELPHPKLRQRARKIRRIDKGVLKIAYDMVDTLREAGGVGLAANQIGVLRRIIVVQLPEEEEASIYINPEILSREGEREVEEACLSVPGYRGTITRSLWVKFGALDHGSNVVKLKAECLLSQVLEHEVDHLNGILYVDHLEEHQKLIPVSSEPDAEPDEATSTDGATARPEAVGVDGVQQVSSQGMDQMESPASLKVR